MVHAQHPWAIGASGLKIGRKLNIPVLFTNHTRYEYYVDYVPPLLPKKLLIKIVEDASTRFANKSDAVIAPTPGIEDYLRKNGVTKPIYVAPSGVDFSALQSSPSAKLRSKYKIPKEDRIIINVSRIGPEKNLPTILKAFKLILEKEPNTTLVMVGGGPFLEELKKIAKQLKVDKKTIFTDLVPFEAVGGNLKDADLFIHASLSETQGLVMLEAMAMSLPVMAVKASGVIDIVESNKNGQMTENSPEALAEATLKALLSKTEMAKLTKGALATAREYEVGKTTKRLEGIYKELVK
ncbi:glycosyltransferase [Patescibacteria group bacterium]|nr:glycosyltransferase [Patescibacteria group bacterium]